jgi:hypothetical protein
MLSEASLPVMTMTFVTRDRPRHSSSYRINRNASRPFIAGTVRSMQIRLERSPPSRRPVRWRTSPDFCLVRKISFCD